MGKAFNVDGVVIEEDNKKLLVSIDHTIMSVLANWLKACPPVDVQALQKEVNQIDSQISELSFRRFKLRKEIMSIWHSSSDKRHRAIQALGHQIGNALPAFWGNAKPEDLGLEIFDDKESEESIER